MRHSSHTDYLVCTDFIDYGDGRTSIVDYDGNLLTLDLERSDVTKTPVDQNGWRKPSPYGVTSLNREALYGDVSVVTTYPLRPEIPPTTTQITGYLPLSNAARINALRPSVAADCELNGENVANRLVVQALLKLRDQKVNLAVAFAEAEKSISMIADRSLKLYRSYRALRGGNFTAAWKEIGLHPGNKGKKVASSVLEVQYGWRPLMQDIEGAYDEIRRPVRADGYLIKVKSTFEDVSKALVSYNGSTTGYSPFNVVQDDTLLKRSQVSLWYVVDNDMLLTASAIGVTNPMEIVWEVTPYSFLLDWIIPVGNFLGALTATTGTRFIGGTLTHSSRFTRKYSVEATHVSNGVTDWVGSGSAAGKDSRFEMSRSVYQNSPIPSLYIKNPLSGGHALNAIALLRGLFK